MRSAVSVRLYIELRSWVVSEAKSLWVDENFILLNLKPNPLNHNLCTREGESYYIVRSELWYDLYLPSLYDRKSNYVHHLEILQP